MSEFSTHTMVFRSQKRSLDLFVSNYEQLPFNSNDEMEIAKKNIKAFDLYGVRARTALKRHRAGSPSGNGTSDAGSLSRKSSSSTAVALHHTRQQNTCGNSQQTNQTNSELSLLLPSPSLAAADNDNENVNSSVLALTAQKRKMIAPVSLKPTWHAPWKLYRVIAGHLGWVRCVAVEPANQWFATGANDRVIKIWDLATGQLKVSLTGHVSTVRGLSVSARHPYLFSAGEDKQVKCWDLECNKVVRHYHGHLSAVHALDLHPSIDLLVTAGRDSTVRVWDMRTKANVLTLTGHTSTVSSVICQSADPQIVSGSHDTTIRLWDLTAGTTFCTLTNHKKSVRSVIFHPTLNQFASASPDTIKKWMCPDGRFIQTFSGHNAILNTLAVNDRGVLVSGADNGTVNFWDWKTGYNFQRVQSAVQPGSMDSEAGIFHLCFDRSGRRLISAEADKTIKIYREDETATEDTHPINWRPEVQRKKRF